jgi:dienelactone hydrolase
MTSSAGFRVVVLLVALLLPRTVSVSQQFPGNWRLDDPSLIAYFDAEVSRIESACLADVRTLEDWESMREDRRRQFLDMLGLWPLPERTELAPVVTGQLEGAGFTVEKLHFQSMPGLYVTANFYLPKERSGPVPAILYVCGHAEVKTNGVSLGNKTAYQHHGAWLAQNGYACLVIDTLQLGEIQGDHHGTYRLGQWWWNSRGYTPAGVEAWNGVRALDYLGTRPEVDAERIGMTGRSGGGSYTWTTAAIDARVKVAAPVAGITDLRNHVCDGAVEGHCDCMFFINTHRWDFPMNAALIAPRPLLIVNTDADSIFPLDGVNRVFAQARRIYALHGAYDRVGLVIGPGGHNDSQNLQVPVLRWFNQHLKGQDPLIIGAAEKRIPPVDLRSLADRPADQRNTTAQEFFGGDTRESVETLSELRSRLRERVFMGWPHSNEPLMVREEASVTADGLRLRVVGFQSQAHVPLHLFLVDRPGNTVRKVDLNLLDDAGWESWLAGARRTHAAALERFPRVGSGEGTVPGGVAPTPPAARTESWPAVPEGTVRVWFSPRGLGPATWSGDARKQVQIRRRFQLLGQTLDGMRVWDVLRAMETFRELQPGAQEISIRASGTMASHALHAAAFVGHPTRLYLDALPESYRAGPDYLNVARITDPTHVLRWVRTVHTVEVMEEP